MLVVLLKRLFVLELGRRKHHPGVLVSFPCPHLSGGIDDSHILGLQVVSAVRDQVHYGAHLPLSELPAGLELHDYRSARLFLLVEENPLFGQGQVDSCGVYFLYLGYCPGELALQSPLVIDLLDEVGHSEGGLVEYLEADPAALRQPFPGKLHPGLVDLVGRDADGRAVDLIGDLFFLELFDDCP